MQQHKTRPSHVCRSSEILIYKKSAESVQRPLLTFLFLPICRSIIILFVLISGIYGYAVMPFMTLVAVVLVITNAKLVQIIRAVTSRGGAGKLTSKIFWFNRPQLLLIPIKVALFLCAFIYASFLFFAW